MQVSSSVRSLLLGLGLLALAGCGHSPSNAAYLNRGGPESLLDVSSEVVTLNAGTTAELDDLSNWVEKDIPSRAELNCKPADRACVKAQRILEKHEIPYSMGAANDQSVTLTYERILARDCNQRYVDNPDNFYNKNHPAFGCSVAANIVQHVTDKQEFINPAISDDPAATRAVNDIRRAYTPRPVDKPYNIGESVVSKAKSE